MSLHAVLTGVSLQPVVTLQSGTVHAKLSTEHSASFGVCEIPVVAWQASIVQAKASAMVTGVLTQVFVAGLHVSVVHTVLSLQRLACVATVQVTQRPSFGPLVSQMLLPHAGASSSSQPTHIAVIGLPFSTQKGVLPLHPALLSGSQTV